MCNVVLTGAGLGWLGLLVPIAPRQRGRSGAHATWVCSALLLALHAPLPAAVAGEGNGAAEVEPVTASLLCLPDRPVVGVGNSVELKAWSAAPGASFRWAVEVGELANGTAANARWTLEQAIPGHRYAARVTMNVPEAAPVNCVLEITASLPELELKGEQRVDRRMFLYPPMRSPEGYGLYTYFVLPKPPVRGSEAERRILAALVELLRFPDVDELRTRAQVSRLRSLHAVQLLLETRADDVFSDAVGRRDWDRAAAWVLDHYNFNRSRELAESIKEITRIGEGPYFISLGSPHRFGEDIVGPYLFQDHSQATERLAALWINGFLNQAWQDRYWEPRMLDRVLIRTRTLLELAARATGGLREGVSAPVGQWVKIGS